MNFSEIQIGILSAGQASYQSYYITLNSVLSQYLLLVCRFKHPINLSLQNLNVSPTFISVIFLYGNVWFGVRDFVSQRERECVEVDLIKIGISYI